MIFKRKTIWKFRPLSYHEVDERFSDIKDKKATKYLFDLYKNNPETHPDTINNLFRWRDRNADKLEDYTREDFSHCRDHLVKKKKLMKR